MSASERKDFHAISSVGFDLSTTVVCASVGPQRTLLRSEVDVRGRAAPIVPYQRCDAVRCYAVAIGIETKFNSDWRSAITERYGAITEEQWATVSLDKMCSDPSAASKLEGFCDTYASLNLMKLGSLGAATLGLGLLVFIFVLGRLARSSRMLLLALFGPGLYVTLFSLIVLIALDAILAICALYLGESVAVHRVHVGIILAMGLGALVSVLGIIRASFTVLGRAETTVVGKSLDRRSHQSIWTFVTDLSRSVGARAPDHIVAGLTPNFFVTEAKVRCLDGVLTGQTMYLSLPLCRLLSKEELKPVIVHELARPLPPHDGPVAVLRAERSRLIVLGMDGRSAQRLSAACRICSGA